jgi:hypothetical protein
MQASATHPARRAARRQALAGRHRDPGKPGPLEQDLPHRVGVQAAVLDVAPEADFPEHRAERAGGDQLADPGGGQRGGAPP